MMRKLMHEYAFLALLAGAIVALDQISKAWIRSSLPLGAAWSPWEWLTPYARLVHWYNTGSAFGMLQGYGSVFAVLAVLVSLAILYWFPRIPRQEWVLRLAVILQLAGALGNLIDRLTIGHVTDFISVGTFPVLNVADASLSVGAGLLLLSIFLQSRRSETQETQPAA